jgi:hypothetical protein
MPGRHGKGKKGRVRIHKAFQRQKRLLLRRRWGMGRGRRRLLRRLLMVVVEAGQGRGSGVVGLGSRGPCGVG